MSLHVLRDGPEPVGFLHVLLDAGVDRPRVLSYASCAGRRSESAQHNAKISEILDP